MAKQIVYAYKNGSERISRDEALPADLQAVLDQRRAESIAHTAALAALSDQYFLDPRQVPNMELGGPSC